MKLHEIVAIQKSVKARTYKRVSDAHKLSQKPELFSGFAKTFEALDEDQNLLPDEDKKVQCFVDDQLRLLQSMDTESWDTELTLEAGNAQAHADIIVDGQTVMTAAPIGFLFFLEKQLVDVQNYIKALPTLDASKDWAKDPNSYLYKTNVMKTTKKVRTQEPVVLYEATDKHPAQVQLLPKDVTIGTYSTTGHSGAIPIPRKDLLLERAAKLIEAVKTARARANSLEITRQNCGAQIFSFLLS